jgi:hypothetical protein
MSALAPKADVQLAPPCGCGSRGARGLRCTGCRHTPRRWTKGLLQLYGANDRHDGRADRALAATVHAGMCAFAKSQRVLDRDLTYEDVVAAQFAPLWNG